MANKNMQPALYLRYHFHFSNFPQICFYRNINATIILYYLFSMHNYSTISQAIFQHNPTRKWTYGQYVKTRKLSSTVAINYTYDIKEPDELLTQLFRNRLQVLHPLPSAKHHDGDSKPHALLQRKDKIHIGYWQL